MSSDKRNLLNSAANMFSYIARVLIWGAIVIVSGGIVLIILPLFFPGCGHVSHVKDRVCQSNLKYIGYSIKMYMSDWSERYPTNRTFLADGKLGPICASVKLSPAGINSKTGSPIRFRHGIAWVEGLYNYMEPRDEQNEASNVWKCPSASKETSPIGSKTAFVTYVLNRNIIELSQNDVRFPDKLMLAREMNCLVNSDIRPTNYSTNNPKASPKEPFIHDRIHGNGSYILFADGHVKLFSKEAFSSKCAWSPDSKVWYNNTDSQSPVHNLVMITP